MSEQSSLSLGLKTADHLWRAAFGVGLAYFLWGFSSDDFWMFSLFAALCALGGAIRLGKAIICIIRLLLKRREIAKYAQKGAAPKADRMSGASDLKRKGLIR